MPKEYTLQQKQEIVQKYLDMVRQGVNKTEVYQVLGVAPRTIYKWLNELGPQTTAPPPADLTSIGKDIGVKLLQELSQVDRGDFKAARTLLALAQAYASLVKTLMELQAFSSSGAVVTDSIVELVQVRRKLEAIYGGENTPTNP